MRLYKWMMGGDKWKVDLARFSSEDWDLDPLTQRMRELRQKYQIE